MIFMNMKHQGLIRGGIKMNENNLNEEIYAFLVRHKGKVIGAILGFIFGIIFLTVGFFKTILILLCIIIGILIGSRWDVEGNVKKFLNKLLPPQFK